MKNELVWEKIKMASSIGIAGHINPDGDCVGSCLALYNYLQENFNEDGKKQIDVYLESCPKEFLFLKNATALKQTCAPLIHYDIFIVLDSGSIDRIEKQAQELFYTAITTVTIDHHISNTSFANVNIVDPKASSTCEVLYGLLDSKKISKEVAECIYLGIVHDTGVFKHSCTTEQTMIIAGHLLTLGVNSEKIIDETFYQKTYVQNQVLGRCLLESILVMNGKIIVSTISKRIQEFYKVGAEDLSGVIDQLRVTQGVEVAIFLREENVQEYKVSMRSNGVVDVSKIAMFFGGGGHIKAAGCTMYGSVYDVINNLTAGIEHQLGKEV